MAGAHTLAQMLGLDLDRYYPYLVGGLCLVILVLASLYSGMDQTLKVSDYGGMSVLVFALGYPLLYTIADFLRRVI